MHSIMCKIDTIYFASDYNDLSQHEKNKWLCDAYTQQFYDLFEGRQN